MEFSWVGKFDADAKIWIFFSHIVEKYGMMAVR